MAPLQQQFGPLRSHGGDGLGLARRERATAERQRDHQRDGKTKRAARSRERLSTPPAREVAQRRTALTASEEEVGAAASPRAAAVSSSSAGLPVGGGGGGA